MRLSCIPPTPGSRSQVTVSLGGKGYQPIICLDLHYWYKQIGFFVFAAIDLITNLLQVKMRKRYSVDKSLSHVYLQVAH